MMHRQITRRTAEMDTHSGEQPAHTHPESAAKPAGIGWTIGKWVAVGLVFAGSFSLLVVVPEPNTTDAATNTIADQVEGSSVDRAERPTNTMADQLAAGGAADSANNNTIAEQMPDDYGRSAGEANTIADQVKRGESGDGAAASNDG